MKSASDELAMLLAAQWGPRSLHYATTRIQRCEKTGDLEGARQWRKVFEALAKIAQEME